MSDVTIAAIVATSENNCIGRGNDLPWYIPADLKRTKDITMGKPLIMGRKTYESIADRRGGKPLPGRDSLVISRTMEKPDFENVYVLSSLEEAIELGQKIAVEKEQDEVIIFGGAQIYMQSLEQTDKIYLTKVHMTIEDGDAFFPELNEEEWQIIDETRHQSDDGLEYSYITLERHAS